MAEVAPQQQIQVTTSISQGQEQASAKASQSQAEEQAPIEPSSGSQMSKNVRGATRMQEVWTMNAEKRIAVQLNAQYIPIGDESNTLSNFIGSMVRKFNYAPINYLGWTEMSIHYKTDMWNIVESKFEFVPYKDESDEEITEEIEQEQLEAAKSWVFRNMSGKWRQWKNYLKSTRFDPSKTVDEMVDMLDDSMVAKDQFKTLVEYWCSEKAKV
ncbi:hypothetical protein CCACVL1_18275 [Corchorus capsularis]|uniref:Transposase, Ptta/En/Spm, plant n=1 Tax=Corchorus capsularis TaxID=210143 RepID=A0A1R3HLT6_COCAP|nr:hypothetical protein CCACVL1_18275 [Corchorus capsularis]